MAMEQMLNGLAEGSTGATAEPPAPARCTADPERSSSAIC